MGYNEAGLWCTINSPYCSLALTLPQIVIEHEKLGSTILTALDDVGGTLSRIELAESLYPTDKMRDTIVTLNCHIMTFLCRAIDWYKMSSFSRTVQSITRPAALRYDDVIQDITKTMSKVTDLAAASSQAEQRDMHEELQSESRSQQDFRLTVLRLFEDMQQQLNSLAQQNTSGDLGAIHQQLRQITGVVHDIGNKQGSSEKLLLQEMVLMKQDLRATQVDIHHRLDEVQLDQAITFIFSKCAFDHKLAYEHAVIRRKVHRVSAGKCAPFWDSRQLQRWDQATSHSSIILTSTFRDRLNIRDFYTGVIEQLIQSRVAVFWVIQEKHQNGQGFNVFEVLKSLVAQSLSKIPSPTIDTRLSFRVQAFATATTINEHTTLLAELLSKFQLVYIVVDTNALASDTIDDCRDALSNVVQLLRERSQNTVLKTMFIGYGSLRTFSAARTAPENVVRVAQTSKRKGKRVPQAPLRGKSRSLPKRETPVDTKNRWGKRLDGD